MTNKRLAIYSFLFLAIMVFTSHYANAENITGDYIWQPNIGSNPAYPQCANFGCARSTCLAACQTISSSTVECAFSGSVRPCRKANGSASIEAVRSTNPCIESSGGLNPDTGLCEDLCEPPNQINPVTGDCEEPLCPEGYSHINVLGSTSKKLCFRDLPGECPNGEIVGYFNGKAFCSDEQRDCIDVGGSVGLNPDGSPGETCFPRDQPAPDDNIDDNPPCGAGNVKVWNAAGDSFTCEPMDEPDDIPQGPDPDDDGTGTGTGSGSGSGSGSGTGTGTGSGTGTGAPDPNSPGDGDGDGDGTVSGGGNCTTAPFCEGDAIQCAILFQTWKARCNDDDEKVTGDADCSQSLQCEGDPIDCAQLQWQRNRDCDFQSLTTTDIESSAEVLNNLTEKIEGEDIDFEEEFGNPFTTTPTVAGCPADRQISLSSGSYSFSYTNFCTLAESVNPLVMLSFSLTGFLIIIRAFS